MRIALPHPSRHEALPGALALDSIALIFLAPETTELDYEAAKLVQAEMQRVTGRLAPISRAMRPAAEDGLLEILPTAMLEGQAEAYTLAISPTKITLAAATPLGRLWAAQTLRQLLRLHGEALPCLRVEDAPAMRYRGVLLDVSRRKVPTVETLKSLVDTLSLLKLNMLQLQVEHTFAFRRHPLIGQGCGSLTSEDILELDAHCRRRGVELVPMLQSFGHMRNTLLHEQYLPLAEHPEMQWSLCPIDPASLRFLDELYEEFLPCFSSGLINIGCDETIDLGRKGGRSFDEIARLGQGRVYLNFILSLHRLLTEKYGKQVMAWGDILLHYPELVSEVPDDLILLNWTYEGAEHYPQVGVFAEYGRTQIVCPGTSSWNTIFPRVETAWENVANLTADGRAEGALGMLNTDWGDGGHYNLLGNSFYSYAHGAEVSWSAEPLPRDEFDALLGPVLFGAGGEEIVQAFRALGDQITAQGVMQCNGSLTADMIFSSALEDERQRMVPTEQLALLASTAAASAHTFSSSAASSQEPSAVLDMAWAADAVAFAAEKCVYLQEVRAFALLRAPRAEQVDALIERSILLLYRHDALVNTFTARWLAGNRPSEIAYVLSRFAHGSEGLRVVSAWLREHRAAFTTGNRAPLPEIPPFRPPWYEDFASLWNPPAE